MSTFSFSSRTIHVIPLKCWNSNQPECCEIPEKDWVKKVGTSDQEKSGFWPSTKTWERSEAYFSTLTSATFAWPKSWPSLNFEGKNAEGLRGFFEQFRPCRSEVIKTFASPNSEIYFLDCAGGVGLKNPDCFVVKQNSQILAFNSRNWCFQEDWRQQNNQGKCVHDLKEKLKFFYIGKRFFCCGTFVNFFCAQTFRKLKILG